MFGEFFGIAPYYNLIFMLLLLITSKSEHKLVVFALILNTINLEVSNYLSTYQPNTFYLFNIVCELAWAGLAIKLLSRKSAYTVAAVCLLVALSHAALWQGLISEGEWKIANRVGFEVIVGTVLSGTQLFKNITEWVHMKSQRLVTKINSRRKLNAKI